MARVRRLKVRGEVAYYHIISRIVGSEYYLGDTEKEKLFMIIKRYAQLYLVKIIGFCIMDNHFHLLVKSEPESAYTDEEILEKLVKFYGGNLEYSKKEIERYRDKLEDISGFVQSFKQTFTRWYNKVNGRNGYLWGDRFKSVLIEEGTSLLNCLAYIDLNPMRAGIVDRPEDYRWSGIGYYIGSGNKDKLLSLGEAFEMSESEPGDIAGIYRELVYRAGGIYKDKKEDIDAKATKGKEKRFKVSGADKFRYRVRYFSDGLVIGSKEFISRAYAKFGGSVILKSDRSAHKTGIGDDIFSLRKLRAV